MLPKIMSCCLYGKPILGSKCRTLASPWGNEDTQTLIDILEKYHVKATFFVVGDWIDKYPESVQELHNAGHEVMCHSNHHDHYNSLSTEQITADLKECCDKTEKLIGVRPTLIRCPYGEYDNHVIAAIRSYGMEPIQWDVERLHTKERPCGSKSNLLCSSATARNQDTLKINAPCSFKIRAGGIFISDSYFARSVPGQAWVWCCGASFTIDLFPVMFPPDAS